jgi:anti-sigma B factor antagonist
MDYKSNIFTELNSKKINLSLSGEFFNKNRTIIIIKVSGYLETANTDIFLKSILKIINENNEINIFVLDLKNLNYISSTGIGALITIISQIKKNSKHLYLINLNEKALSILEMLGFKKFFNILDSNKELNSILNRIKSNS